MTLIVADVGGFKSATMINIALNVCEESKENVLYVSLEMPKKRLMQRIISRQSRVDSKKVANPAKLSPEERAKVQSAAQNFKNYSSKFAIIDAEERMTVASIKAEIEKRLAFFRPRLVVIDYISILAPEARYQKLAEHSWYGQMCKDLRAHGRKIGYAVLSAVQLNREAIKSLRGSKGGGNAPVGSDSLRGSHDFSADADHIYIQAPHPDQPKEKLHLYCVKARYGSTMFGALGNQSKAVLDVDPRIGLVMGSIDAKVMPDQKDEFIDSLMKRAPAMPEANPDLDLDFRAEEAEPEIVIKQPKRSNKQISTDELFR
jgi:replicative DNA helicase